MQIKDWFLTPYSRDDLAEIYVKSVNQTSNSLVSYDDIKNWGRCKLAAELEIISSGSFTKG